VEAYSQYLLKHAVGQRDAVSEFGTPLKVAQYSEFKHMTGSLLSEAEASEYG